MNRIYPYTYQEETPTPDKPSEIINFWVDEAENKYIQKLEQENKQLKEDKKKARDYIKNYDIFKEFSFPLMKRDEENQVKSSIDYQFKNDLYKNLLILLGDKENE